MENPSRYRPREASTLIDRALREFPVVVVSGLRQTGKSTLLREDLQMAAGRRYLTLDDLDVLTLARDDPVRLLSSADRLALDEVQRSPEIFLSIKRLVDERRSAGRFVLSGSANLLLHQRTADSLAGRAYYAYLRPLNRRERLSALAEKPALLRFLEGGTWPAVEIDPVTETEILRGGFPEIALDERRDAGLWFDAFERTYLERDVRDLRQIENLVDFHRFLRLTALRVGGVLNVSALARDARLSEATARRYLNLFETLMLVHRLPPFLGNRSSRLVKAPKLFFADSGLCARLAGVNAIGASDADPMRGPLFENFVLQNLMATLEPHRPGIRFYFWNEQGRREVDIVAEFDSKVIALEVKSRGRLHPADFDAIESFIARTPNCAAGIIGYQGREVLPLRPKLWAVPLHVLLA